MQMGVGCYGEAGADGVDLMVAVSHFLILNLLSRTEHAQQDNATWLRLLLLYNIQPLLPGEGQRSHGKLLA